MLALARKLFRDDPLVPFLQPIMKKYAVDNRQAEIATNLTSWTSLATSMTPVAKF